MASKPANAEQKRWMTDITAWSYSNLHLLYGGEFENSYVQRHHVLGRAAKHNKVAIGHEFIIPVPFELHDVSSNHPDNVTHRKKSFVGRFGAQKTLFNTMYQSMKNIGYKVPNICVYNAIMDTSA